MIYTYIPKGVCSRKIDIELLEGNIIGDVVFTAGCEGNLKAIPKLIKGMPAEEVIAKLEGNTCGRRSTSCADQLTKGLREAMEANK